ncbi:hypothetical protein FMUBM48_47130 [Nocardia cyriacigeorgica]|nr:hypothetical protein FMUBM48_47130 [Nocardia cyriacigeorgica]
MTVGGFECAVPAEMPRAATATTVVAAKVPNFIPGIPYSRETPGVLPDGAEFTADPTVRPKNGKGYLPADFVKIHHSNSFAADGADPLSLATCDDLIMVPIKSTAHA